MSKRFKDFDAGKEASSTEPIVVKENGKEYKLPPVLSAKVVLGQMTWMNDDGSLAASNLKQWFSSIFGVENLYALEKEVDFKTLQEISAWLMEQYGLGADVVQDQELPTDEDDADSPK